MITRTIFCLNLLTLALALFVGACAVRGPSLHGSPYPAPASAPAMALTDTEGAPFDLTALQPHAVLIYFGYTQCPDECPLTLANAQWAIEQLGERGEQLDFVLVTVDPTNDTPAVLRAYLDQFDTRFIGLTGSDEHLARARAAYGVLAATPDSDHEQTDVIHGTRVYLIDPGGLLIASYDLSVPKEDMLSDVRAILKS